MKVYIILNKYWHSSSNNRYTQGIEKVFNNFFSAMTFLKAKEDKWAVNTTYLNGPITEIITCKYFDIQTFVIDNNSTDLFYVKYQNSNGYENDPKPFQNKHIAEIEVNQNMTKRKIYSIEIDN